MKFVSIGLLCLTRIGVAAEPPRVLEPSWQIEQIAVEPSLVTPTACCFDDHGRLLVIECHTHFPPEDYDGPSEDRIYSFDDSDGDGVLDRQRLFYEGGSATMGLCRLSDGWIAVATRSEVIRIRDSNGDHVADESETLVKLVTEQTYPHNGLTGLAVGPDQWLYIGQGENLGDPYAIVAADGSKQTGGGEGGNIVRCRFDGSDLQRYATGLWNPFGMYFDPAGRLWTVGNDPDAMPPCRLIEIAADGDYGFQFRFGRAGTHPLQAWNGELPGTIPMAAGTGEAPCAIVGYGDRLWVSSWGDNRIEAYRLKQNGASWKSETEVVVQGDANFRPVGMAVADDGSIYVTDWVDRSYPVHQKGRLWRLSRKPGAPAITQRLPERSAAEQQRRQLESDGDVDIAKRLVALDDNDPFIQQAAIAGLITTGQLSSIKKEDAETPGQRVGLLTAWRWIDLAFPNDGSSQVGLSAADRDAWIAWGLADDSPDVAFTAMRWATESGRQTQLDSIRQILERPELSQRLFAGVIASLAYLETGSAARGKRDPEREKRLYDYASNTNHSPATRAIAIRMLPPEAERPAADELSDWIAQDHDRGIGIEAIRLLVQRSNADSIRALAQIAADDTLPEQTRADAAAGLVKNAGEYATELNRLLRPGAPAVVRDEVKRLMRRSWSNEGKRPTHSDLDGWEAIVSTGGDADAGRRVFFRTTCANCHAHQGRGATTGPDLSTLVGQMTPRRLIESILQPSKEIGPLYVPYRVLTVDGQTLTGLKLDKSGVGNSLRFQGADGMIFEVPLQDVEIQEPVRQSIMPTGLEETMSLQELKDLTAFLVEGSDTPR